MRIIIQRVKEASVSVNNNIISSIKQGLLVLLGIEEADDETDIQWLVGKMINLRIFSDEQGIMNLSVKEISGEILVVSQFTLHASTKKGNRPSYIKAAKPEKAIPIYNKFITFTETELGKKIGAGEFGAMMNVTSINDGPVTIIIDSKKKE